MPRIQLAAALPCAIAVESALKSVVRILVWGRNSTDEPSRLQGRSKRACQTKSLKEKATHAVRATGLHAWSECKHQSESWQRALRLQWASLGRVVWARWRWPTEV